MLPAARTDGCAGSAENRRTEQTEGGDGSNAGDERHQNRAARDADAAAQKRTHGFCHARLFRRIGGDRFNFLIDLILAARASEM